MPVTPTRRVGYTDAYHASRLAHINGTTYPAAPAGTFLALYAGVLPLSDGSGGTEFTGTRPAITLSATPLVDGNGRQYVTNAAAIPVTLVNTSAGEIIGFGICAAATGGTPIYSDRLPPFQVGAAAVITIPAGAIRVYAETTIM